MLDLPLFSLYALLSGYTFTTKYVIFYAICTSFWAYPLKITIFQISRCFIVHIDEFYLHFTVQHIRFFYNTRSSLKYNFGIFITIQPGVSILK